MATAISTIGTAETQAKYKVLMMTKQSEIINVSADDLWEIVGLGFENAGVWSTAVDHSVGSGKAEFEGATCSERACDLNASGFSKIKEILTMYNEKAQELKYEVTEGNPGFVVLASNHWKVIKVGENQSRLEMTITMHLKKFMGTLMGGMLKRNINKLIPTIFDDLKIYAETGQISEQKKKRMAKLAS